MTDIDTNEVPVQEAGDTHLEVTIRPGVVFPDWSAVRSEKARAALDAIFKAIGAEAWWDGFGAEEDRVRRAILEAYGELGRAPDKTDLAARSGTAPTALAAALQHLKKHDLVVLDDVGEQVTGAYPLTDRATEHVVQLGAIRVHAMCAIDALGTGAMFGRDVVIESSCRACGDPIRVETRGEGAAIESFAPEGAVVWSGIMYADGCLADSLCTVLAFFCSDAHLESWRKDNHPDIEGYSLSMDEGLQAGKAIFAPMLAPAKVDVESMSTITCPSCGHVKTEEMPIDACMYFYECEGCGTLRKPEKGDCCVFCSYGSVPCPLIQIARWTGKEISAC